MKPTYIYYEIVFTRQFCFTFSCGLGRIVIFSFLARCGWLVILKTGYPWRNKKPDIRYPVKLEKALSCGRISGKPDIRPNPK